MKNLLFAVVFLAVLCSCTSENVRLVDCGFIGELRMVEAPLGDYHVYVTPIPVDDKMEFVLSRWPVPAEWWDYGHTDKRLLEEIWVCNVLTAFAGDGFVPVYTVTADGVERNLTVFGFRPVTDKEKTYARHLGLISSKTGTYLCLTVLKDR